MRTVIFSGFLLYNFSGFGCNLFSSFENYIDQYDDKLDEQKTAGIKIVEAGTHNSPFLYHQSGWKNGKNCSDGVYNDQTVSFADSNKDVVSHINRCTNGATGKKYDKMELVRGKIYTVDNLQKGSSKEMACYDDKSSTSYDNTENPHYIQGEFFEVFQPPQFRNGGDGRFEYKFTHQSDHKRWHEQDTVVSLVFIGHNTCHGILGNVIQKQRKKSCHKQWGTDLEKLPYIGEKEVSGSMRNFCRIFLGKNTVDHQTQYQ